MLNLPRSCPKMAQRRFGSDSAGSSPGSVSPTLHSCVLESPVLQTPRALSAQDEIIRQGNAEASEIEPLMTEESRYGSIENPNPDDQRASMSLHFRGRSSRDEIGSVSNWEILRWGWHFVFTDTILTPCHEDETGVSPWTTMATTSTLWGPFSVLHVLGANFGILWHVEIAHPHLISWRLIFQNTPSLTCILPSCLTGLEIIFG